MPCENRQCYTHDFLDMLTCGLPKRERESRLFAMLVAHVDDSGSHGGGPLFVLAGYVADAGQWKKFTEQWQMALELPPKLKVLKIQHALRFEEGWGRLRGRNKERDRNERLKRFASIIHRHVEFGIVASLAWGDIKKLRTEFPMSKRVPYLMLYHQLMAVVTAHIYKNYPGQKIDFVFDEQGAMSHIAPLSFSLMPPDIAPEFQKLIGGPPTHRSDESVLPLQAAHTIAWLVRRCAQENNRSGEALSTAWKPSQSYLRKLDDIDMIFAWTNYERLAKKYRADGLAAKA